MFRTLAFAAIGLLAAVPAVHACGSAALVQPQCAYVAPQVQQFAGPYVQAFVAPQVSYYTAAPIIAQPQLAYGYAPAAALQLQVRRPRAAVVAPVVATARVRVLRPSLFRHRVAVDASAALVAPY